MTLVVQNTLDPQLYNSLATLTGSQTITNKTLKAIKEPVTLAGAPPGGITDFDVATQSIVLYNTATQNFILNVRGSSAATLNSLIAVGESVGISLLVPAGPGYYLTGVLVDGSNTGLTLAYQGGGGFTIGNANSTDLYMLFLIKTGDNTWKGFISQTKYA